MGFVIFIIIFAIVVIVALIVVFILFLAKGAKGAKEDKTLYEKGMITQDQYDSGFNQSAREVVQDNYAEMRRLSAEERAALRRRNQK